jgi:hypothetical protein
LLFPLQGIHPYTKKLDDPFPKKEKRKKKWEN